MKTSADIAKWAVGGDFPSGESEALGISRVTEWINDLIEAERQALAARFEAAAQATTSTDAAEAYRRAVKMIRARSEAR